MMRACKNGCLQSKLALRCCVTHALANHHLRLTTQDEGTLPNKIEGSYETLVRGHIVSALTCGLQRLAIEHTGSTCEIRMDAYCFTLFWAFIQDQWFKEAEKFEKSSQMTKKVRFQSDCNIG